MKYLSITSIGKAVSLAVLGLLLLTATNIKIFAQSPGDVDPTFAGGVSVLERPLDAILIQPDGKHLIASNNTVTNGRGRNLVTRLNPDGSLDESFVTDGRYVGSVLAMALQPDGRIVIVGNINIQTNPNGTNIKNNIARLNADGTLDTAFSTGGGTDDIIYSIVLQPNGKILIGGRFSNVEGVARRGIALLNSDGSVDTTFNPSTGIGANSNNSVQAIALQPDGKVLVGGLFPTFNGTASSNIVRLNIDGSVDAAFSVGTGANLTVLAIALQADAKILIGGAFSQYNGAAAQYITRLNPNGSQDTSFIEGGACPTNPCTNRFVTTVTQISPLIDGRIYVSSYGRQATNGSGLGNTILRFNADGLLDFSFSPLVVAAAPSFLNPSRHAVQADGKVITGMTRHLIISSEIVSTDITRYNTDGSVDTNYTPVLHSTGAVYDVALQTDGKVVVVGNFSVANTAYHRSIARFNANGTVDTNFNAVIPNSATQVVLQPDGKIIAAGAFGQANGATRGRIVRFNADGTLDAAFNSQIGADIAIYALTLQPDGKVLIGGSLTKYDNVARAGIARLNANGSLDATFNPGTGFAGSSKVVEAIDVQPDGKIVVGGNFTGFNGTPRNNIARLNADGTLDNSFNPGTGTGGIVSAIKTLPNSQILIAGSFAVYNNVPRKGIARINADGSLDTTFSDTAQPNGSISELYVQADGKIILGGNFTSLAGQIRRGVARLTANGLLDTLFGGNMDGAQPAAGIFTGDVGMAVDEANGKMFYGSAFSTFNNIGRGSLVRLFLNSLQVAVTVQTNPAGRSFTIDGVNYNSSQTFNWDSGSTHTISTTSPQSGTAGTQYVWANWSDGGAISHTVSSSADTTYTANFTTQYQLSMNAGAGGTVSPSSGFYDAGQSVQITATPNSGFTFANWTGTGSGSYSGTNNPATATINAPLTQTANFNVQCSYVINPTGTNISAAGGNGSFAVTAPNGCAWTASSNAAWLTTSSAGSGNGTVNYAVAANTGTTRSTTITVGGQLFTVNQSVAGEPNNQPILFTSNRDGNTEIYRMNTDGSNQQRLTNSPESETNPLWSPDGTKIVFTRIVSTSVRQVWTMNADGSNQIRLSADVVYEFNYRYSPNGQKILFERRPAVGVANLWTMNADGTNRVQLTNSTMLDHFADWSPNGSQVAFGRCDPQFVCDVYTVNADGTNLTNLTPTNPNDDDNPKWTRSGNRIVYGRATANTLDTYIMDVDGGNQQNLTNFAAFSSYPQAISPDGNKIALDFQTGTTASIEIYTVGIGGGTPLNITNNTVFDGFSAWSPDSARMAFRSRRDTATDEIYTMNADGSGVVRLTFNTATDVVSDWFRPAPRRTSFDFDGDSKTDIGIFRPLDGSWWYVRSIDNAFRVYSFGNSNDQIVPGDYTGDGKTDIAIWRPSTGEWFIQRSDDNTYYSIPFGTSGDIPVPADYDGDGKFDTAVFRPSIATWFILRSSDGGTTIYTFGASGDKPVPADFDGDGKADLAIFRPSDGSWWYVRSSDNQFRVYSFGVSTDKPVQGDYTGDGKADLAIWRPSTGEWFIQRSDDNTYFSFPFGASGDIPVAGDYDGDGKFDTAVFRPSNSTWFLNRTTAGVGIVTFGTGGDRPIPNAFVP